MKELILVGIIAYAIGYLWGCCRIYIRIYMNHFKQAIYEGRSKEVSQKYAMEKLHFYKRKYTIYK